jgi:hypothetical protein
MDTTATNKTTLWTSYILQGIISTMFLMGAVMNLMQSEMAVTQATEMGYPESSVVYLGIILLIAIILYIIPKTMVLGAILVTAWLGGAITTHIIHGDPLFNTIFPALIGVIIWVAIWLRNSGLKKVFPFNQ